MTLADLVASNGEGLRSPGMYSWWVDSRGAEDLSRGLGHEVAAGLIYAGLAGATRSGGSTSSNTLWGRIATMHLGIGHDLSTLRRSLGSVLASANGWPAIDEVELTRWMHAHLSVVAVPVADADTLDALESEILTELDPPLNLARSARLCCRPNSQRCGSGTPAGNQGCMRGAPGSEHGRGGSWSAEVRRCVVRPA